MPAMVSTLHYVKACLLLLPLCAYYSILGAYHHANPIFGCQVGT
uniref:Uncharacterized protein n=1 Tax=Rhizophora mucronata TaxID=61149 RepID=A0A2P2Q1I8_RHIMU